MIITGLAAVLACLPRPVVAVVLAIQVTDVGYNWIVGPLVGARIDVLSLVSAAVGLAGLVAVFGYLYRRAPELKADPTVQAEAVATEDALVKGSARPA
jgi:hypothetical protein